MREESRFECVATLDQLSEGMPLGVQLSAGERVCLIRVEGDVYAVQDRCTHADFQYGGLVVLAVGGGRRRFLAQLAVVAFRRHSSATPMSVLRDRGAATARSAPFSVQRAIS